MDIKDIELLKERYEEEILSMDGIYAVGIGMEKETGREYELKVYAEKTPGISHINRIQEMNFPYQLIVEPAPEKDILYIKDINAFTEDQGRYRPLLGGIQLYLQNEKSAWLGTLGAFVKSKRSGDNSLYLLSNLHVLESVGLAVCQPVYGDKNIIGMVSEARDFPNSDAALALVNAEDDVALNVFEEIGNVTEIKDITYEDLGKRVVKRGRTTGLTEGTLESCSTTVIVSGIYRYDCAVVRADAGKLFSNSGDSGSPVVMKDETRLIGLHFAGNHESGGTSIFCKIGNVFENLEVELP